MKVSDGTIAAVARLHNGFLSRLSDAEVVKLVTEGKADHWKPESYDLLFSTIHQALEDGLAHPHQQNFVAIEGELDLDELACFITSRINADSRLRVL